MLKAVVSLNISSKLKASYPGFLNIELAAAAAAVAVSLASEWQHTTIIIVAKERSPYQ